MSQRNTSNTIDASGTRRGDYTKQTKCRPKFTYPSLNSSLGSEEKQKMLAGKVQDHAEVCGVENRKILKILFFFNAYVLKTLQLFLLTEKCLLSDSIDLSIS